MLRRAVRKLIREESGETLVAFAMSAGILFGFLLGMTQMCLAFYTYESISEMAREGSRYAMVYGSTCETTGGTSCEKSASTVKTYVTGTIAKEYPNVAGGTVGATVSYPGTGALCSGGSGSEEPGCPVEVTVTYTYPYTIPGLTSFNLSMSSTSEMTIIQ